MRRTSRLFLFIILVVVPVILFSQDRKSIVDETLSQYRPSNPEAAMIIGIFQNGQTEYFRFGSVNAKGKLKPTPETLFEIGGATEVFTSTLMVLESHKGSFLPEDRIEDFLPPGFELPKYQLYNCVEVPVVRPFPENHFSGTGMASICREEDGSPYCISFCDLASHTSGLSNVKGAYRWNPFRDLKFAENPPKYYSMDKLIKRVNHKPLSFKPGEQFRYTNVDLAVMGLALENINGHTMSDMLEINILGPLDMNHTKSLLSTTERKTLAKGFSYKGKPVKAMRLEAFEGSAGLKSSAGDLMTFLKANLACEIPELSEAFEQATAIRVDIPIEKSRWTTWMGYGWFISPLFEESPEHMIWTSGATPGFQTFMALVKDTQTAIVVLTADQSDAQHIGREILQQLHLNADALSKDKP